VNHKTTSNTWNMISNMLPGRARTIQ